MENYHLKWFTQSKNSAESMPVGGHNIGCNVWVENSEVLLYFQQSGFFDENGSMLKGGRVRIGFDRDPFLSTFGQELVLTDGYIKISGESPTGNTSIYVWVDAYKPVIHLQISTQKEMHLFVQYETWRSDDRLVDNQSYELFQCKEVWGDPGRQVLFHHDQLEIPASDEMLFYHRNQDDDLSFDREMDTQGLQAYKDGFYNPQRRLISGGLMKPIGMRFIADGEGKYLDTRYKSFRFESTHPATDQDIAIYLLTTQEKQPGQWKNELRHLVEKSQGHEAQDFLKTQNWWHDYWAKSAILINPDHPDESDPFWRIGRNYQLFRYLLGCNYAGIWPTKFNGGLFTFDPILAGKSPWSDIELRYTPDFRLWGGGSHTMQNQRLLYWPMLKSGDFDMLPQLFNFFLRIQETAKTRARIYFNVDGAHFPEQIGIYGLCPTCDHGWGNTSGLPVPQIRYHFSSQLELAMMIMIYAEYCGDDISKYLDLIENIVMFFDGFYPNNDQNGKMIMEPANALETFHPVRNPIDGIAGLDAVLKRMLALPEKYASSQRRARWQQILERIPALSFTEKSGRKIIASAETTSEHHNCEIPELYTVFPFGQFGLGKPDLQIAIDTALLAPETDEQKTHISWHQQGIQYARLGMLPEALEFLQRKLDNAEMRVPVYWGPGHDWTPDHNWGGSGMIQLQDMLLQSDGDKIYLLPCWPRDIDVTFRLHAPQNTVIDCRFSSGKVVYLSVTPTEREKDVVVM